MRVGWKLAAVVVACAWLAGSPALAQQSDADGLAGPQASLCRLRHGLHEPGGTRVACHDDLPRAATALREPIGRAGAVGRHIRRRPRDPPA